MLVDDYSPSFVYEEYQRQVPTGVSENFRESESTYFVLNLDRSASVGYREDIASS